MCGSNTKRQNPGSLFSCLKYTHEITSKSGVSFQCGGSESSYKHCQGYHQGITGLLKGLYGAQNGLGSLYLKWSWEKGAKCKGLNQVPQLPPGSQLPPFALDCERVSWSCTKPPASYRQHLTSKKYKSSSLNWERIYSFHFLGFT